MNDDRGCMACCVPPASSPFGAAERRRARGGWHGRHIVLPGFARRLSDGGGPHGGGRDVVLSGGAAGPGLPVHVVLPRGGHRVTLERDRSRTVRDARGRGRGAVPVRAAASPAG